MRNSITEKGYTLVELLLVVAIIALVATITMPVFGLFRTMATNAACVSRLRHLHLSFNNYLQDHEMVWPQVPNEEPDEEREWKWWYETMKEYGVGRHHWICPGDSDSKATLEGKKTEEEYAVSYLPTLFDDAPNTAFRWNQPWVVEKAGFHGKDKGPNMVMPDGAITEGPSFLAPQ